MSAPAWARELAMAAVAAVVIVLGVALAVHWLVGGGSDRELAQRVVERLATLPTPTSSPIEVHSTDGVIYLSGVVESPGELLRAERLARRTRGVRGVVNDLTIARVNAMGLTAAAR